MLDNNLKTYAEYLKRFDEESRVMETQTVTSKFDTPYVSMLDAIAEMYGETRTAILKKIIETGTVQLFESFEPQAQSKLAQIADKKMTDFMLSKGHKIKSINALGTFENEWCEWRSHIADSDFFKFLERNKHLPQEEAIEIYHREIKGDK